MGQENIGLGRPDADEEEIERAAILANAHDFILDLPDGYDTLVGERGDSLSAGQRQRIAIARAALRSAPIAILDEPLTGLDEEGARVVNSALDRLTRDKTCFLITHDLKQATRSDRILVLAENGVAELGSHEDLIQRNGLYADLVRMSETNGSSENGKRDVIAS